MGDKKITKARKKYNEGSFKEAIQFLLKIAENVITKNELVEINRLLGWCHYHLSRSGNKEEELKKAISSFKTALMIPKIDKKSKISCRNGIVLSLWKNLMQEKAKKLLEKNIKQFSDSPSVWNIAGILEQEKNNLETAKQNFQKSYKLSIKNRSFRVARNALKNLAETYYRNEKYTKALKCSIVAKNTYKKDSFHKTSLKFN